LRICIIAEGCYPYVVGGVSSWVQTLATSLKEHQFVIYTIVASKKQLGRFKYEIPPNVLDIKEISLEQALYEDGKWGKHYKLSEMEQKAVSFLLSGEKPDWNIIFNFFTSNKKKKTSDFLKSKTFFDLVKQVYENKYSSVPFTEFYWTVRSMYVTLFHILKQDIEYADIYHSVSTGYAGVLGSKAAYMYKKPFLLTEHGIYTREREEEIIKADWIKGYLKDIWIGFFYSMSWCAYEYARKVVSLFSANQELQHELGCSREKTIVVPNGVESDFCENTAKKPDSENIINIGAIVRIEPIKDIVTMLQSFNIIKSRLPETRFYIIGPIDENREYFDECTHLADTLGTKDVIFTGNVNIKEYIGKMDILVLSSISEGQPLAVLEGMICKKPYVATNVGNCRELLYGNNDNLGNCGIVVPVMDYEKMAESIIKLSKNKALRDKMGKAGYKRVMAFYTKEKFINKYRELYSTREEVH
jgi:polysaccharide biosynthesis protein PelF